MNEQMIELLIGKFIDSEITPAEQRLLDAELLRNPQTRRLLENALDSIGSLTEQMKAQAIMLHRAQGTLELEAPPSEETPLPAKETPLPAKETPPPAKQQKRTGWLRRTFGRKKQVRIGHASA